MQHPQQQPPQLRRRRPAVRTRSRQVEPPPQLTASGIRAVLVLPIHANTIYGTCDDTLQPAAAAAPNSFEQVVAHAHRITCMMAPS